MTDDIVYVGVEVDREMRDAITAAINAWATKRDSGAGDAFILLTTIASITAELIGQCPPEARGTVLTSFVMDLADNLGLTVAAFHNAGDAPAKPN